MTPTSDPSPCDTVAGRIAEGLGALERGERPPEADLAFVRVHLGRCARCTARQGHRFADLEARSALARREVPPGLLDDLWSQIRARVPTAPVGGAMSQAFLDAPRSLALWRTGALAAGLLLALGAGLVATGVLAPGSGGRTPAATGEVMLDVPPGLLPAWDASAAAGSEPARLWPVHAERLRPGAGLFRPQDPLLVPVGASSGDDGWD